MIVLEKIRIISMFLEASSVDGAQAIVDSIHRHFVRT